MKNYNIDNLKFMYDDKEYYADVYVIPEIENYGQDADGNRGVDRITIDFNVMSIRDINNNKIETNCLLYRNIIYSDSLYDAVYDTTDYIQR